MQSFIRVFALAALSAFLATASLAAPGSLAKRDIDAAPTTFPTHKLPARHWTNAERMARGLPPRAPRKLYREASRTERTSCVLLVLVSVSVSVSVLVLVFVAVAIPSPFTSLRRRR